MRLCLVVMLAGGAHIAVLFKLGGVWCAAKPAINSICLRVLWSCPLVVVLGPFRFLLSDCAAACGLVLASADADDARADADDARASADADDARADDRAASIAHVLVAIASSAPVGVGGLLAAEAGRITTTVLTAVTKAAAC